MSQTSQPGDDTSAIVDWIGAICRSPNFLAGNGTSPDGQSGNPKQVEGGEDNRSRDRRQQAGPATSPQPEKEHQPRDRNHGRENRRGVNHQRPRQPAVPSLMQVVHDGDEAHHGLRGRVFPGFAINDDVDRIRGTAEQDEAFVVVDTEFRNGTAQPVFGSQMLHHVQPVDGLGGIVGDVWQSQPGVFELPGKLRNSLGVGSQPRRVIERESRNGEEEQRGEAQQRQIKMKPADDPRRTG